MKNSIKIIIYTVILCSIVSATFLIVRSIVQKNNYLPGKFFGEVSDGLLLVTDGEKYGYYDVKEGKLKIKIKYDLPPNLKSFYSDFSKIDSGSIQVFDEIKRLISDFNYKYGYIKIGNNGLYGLADKDENVILEPKYRNVIVYDKDLILVCEDYFYFVNSKGEKLTNNDYTIASRFGENFVKVMENDKLGLLTSNLTSVLDTLYDKIWFIGYENNYIIETQNENMYSYYLYSYSENKLEKLPIDEKINIKNYDNNIITYYKGENEFYNYNVVSKNETYLGKYNKVGKYVNGVAYAIGMDNKINYIDYDGKIVIPLNYNTEIGMDFSKYDLAVVYDNNKAKVIDRQGKIISEGYEYSSIINDKLFIAGNSGLYLVNEKFNPISDEYILIREINDNKKYLLVSNQTNDGIRYGLINYDGKEVVPCKYLKVDVYDDYLVLQEEVGKNIIKKL